MSSGPINPEFFSGLDLDRHIAEKDRLIRSIPAASTFLTYSQNDVDPPDEFDFTPYHHLEDQSSIGSCSGNGTTSAMECTAFIESSGRCVDESGKTNQLSRMYCYLRAQEFDGLIGRDDGATMTGALRAAKEGVPLEQFLPYPNPPEYSPHIPQAARDHAQLRVREGIFLETEPEMWKFLSGGQGGITIGQIFGRSFRNESLVRLGDDLLIPDVSFDSRGDRHAGGHCLAILGWKHLTIRGRKTRCYRYHNSWNRHWGNNGTALIPSFVMARLLKHRATVAIGLTMFDGHQPAEFSFLQSGGWIA